MDQIKAVVFDIGNVLVEWNPERFFDNKIGERRRRELFASVDLFAMHLGVDRGDPFRETVYALADVYPEFGAEIRLWHDGWREMAAPQITWSVELLYALRAKGMPVFALTNFGAEPFDLSAKDYAFFSEFDQQYISGHLKMLKPDAGIYAAVEAGCGLPPQSLLFTDDRLENIEAAAARSWQTHLFEGPEGWANALVRHGVLSREEAGL